MIVLYNAHLCCPLTLYNSYTRRYYVGQALRSRRVEEAIIYSNEAAAQQARALLPIPEDWQIRYG